MKKFTVMLIAVAAVLAAAGVAAWAAGRGGEGEGAVVARQDVRLTVEATGRLEAASAFEIGPPSVEGFWDYNLSWMIPEGSRVKEGDVIARFDATEIEERLRTAQATQETTTQEREKEEKSLQLRIEQLELDLVKAQGDARELDVQLDVPEGLLSSIELEQKRIARDLARQKESFLREKIGFERKLVRSKLELLDVKIQEAESKIAYNEAAKEKYAVKAPVAGLVMHVPKMRGGERWEVGESVWMLAKILRVADTSTLQVEASLLEADAARVAMGQPAEITVDALPGTVIRSKVDEIGRVIRERSWQDRTKVVDVVLPLQGVDLEQLKPGMGVHVSIETKSLPASLVVPLDAIVATGEGTFVDVLGEGGARERRAVTLGERAGDRVVVREGLREGERVALVPAKARA